MSASVRYAQAGNLDRTAPSDYALGLGGREPGADQVSQHVDREAMRQ